MDEILIPNGLLSIVGLELRPSDVTVMVSSWEEPIRKGKLRFEDSKFSSFDTTFSEKEFEEEPELLDFPWDYYGFDARELENGRWKFTLCSHVLEIVFEAEWPTFTEL